MDSESSPPKLRDIASRERVKWLRTSLIRTAAGVIILALVYVYAPIDRDANVHPLIVLALMLVFFAVVIYFSTRRIMTDDYPQLRAAQVAVLTISLYLFGFAALYLSMSTINPDYFTEPLSHTGAFYFTVAITSTVGFGDITPTNDLARIVVTAQMILNIVLIGVGIRAFLALGKMQASHNKTSASSKPPTSE